MADRVRIAVPADAAGLARLAALTFPLACTPQTPDEVKAAFIAEHLGEQSFAGYLAHSAHTLLVAEDEASGSLVGYTMLVEGEPTDPDVAHVIRLRPTVELSKMYVDPARHGTGTAHHLMTATIDAARGTGAAGAWLGVSEENARANAFYARHGFEQVGRKLFHLGDRWEHDFVRERAL